MGSLGKFKKARGKSVDRLAEVAGEPDGSALFVRILAEYGVWVIEKNLDSGKESMELLEHVEGDQVYLAVFSSKDPAAEFVGKLPPKTLTSFIFLGGSPAVLLDDMYNAVILNPRTATERKISRRDLTALRVLCYQEQDSELE